MQHCKPSILHTVLQVATSPDNGSYTICGAAIHTVYLHLALNDVKIGPARAHVNWL